MAPPLALLKPLPFKEAIDAFRRRAGNPAVSDRWTDVWQDQHSAQATVARSIGFDIMGDINGAMESALAEGTTLAEFSKTLRPVLEAKGWWGKTVRPDGETVQLGSARRLALIFNTNMRVSYAAGRWEQIQRTKADLPYLMYSAVLDSRTRPAHRAWHGTILPIDDPWWLTHYPPCGWNCRCSVIQLTASAAKKRGITEKAPSSRADRRFFNPSTGKTMEVPYGIDPGWGYNVGMAAQQANAEELAAKTLADKTVALPAAMAAGALENRAVQAIGRELAAWVGRIATPVGDSRVVGTMSADVVGTLKPAGSGAIVLTDAAVADLPSKLLAGLPQRIAAADDVLINGDGSNLLWMITGADGEKAALEVALAGGKGGNLITGWRPADTVDNGQWRLL